MLFITKTIQFRSISYRVKQNKIIEDIILKLLELLLINSSITVIISLNK